MSQLLPAHGSRRRLVSTLIAFLSLALFWTIGAAPATAIPIRGNTPWSVLLCKFAGTTGEPQPVSYFQRMFTTAGIGWGGTDDYFSAQSQGSVRLTGSVVRGWYTMPFTKAQQAPKSRWQKIQDCVGTAAARGYTVPAGNRIVVVTNEQQDGGSAGGRVLLDPGSINLGFATHEMGHGYGLGHSFSNDLSYRNAPWSAPGEYDDPWDLMSAMNIYTAGSNTFGDTSVGLNGYFRDKLGWLPMSSVFTLGRDGVASRTIALTGLEAGGSAGVRLIRVPIDVADPFHYYTVEYRLKASFSRGIPANTVLINEVKNGTPTLIRQLQAPDRAPATSLAANGAVIRTISTGPSTAVVSVFTPLTTRCVMGYVWREARQGDLVCVTGATRSQASYDNAVRYNRWVVGAYGPHTCINGYVWREAFAGDDVCVLPSVRTQASVDNAAAAARSNPARFSYGPNTCAAGYVWREADGKDYVCVSGGVRAQARYDNAVRFSRWVVGAYGAHTCRMGYVWREGWPGDDVCVTPAVRTQTRVDNALAATRLMRPGG